MAEGKLSLEDRLFNQRKLMMRDLDLLIRDNTPDIFYNCLQTLQLIVNNILNNPSEPKYQKIPIAAKKFTDTVLKAKNGFEFLLDCGFQRQVFEFKEHIVLKIPDYLPAARDLLEDTIKKVDERHQKFQKKKEMEKNEEMKHKEELLKAIDADRKSRQTNK